MTGALIGEAVPSVRLTAALQQAHLPPDSIAVESPLPGGVAHVVRFLLNTVPTWMQLGGIVLGAIVMAFAVWLIVTRRRVIVEWFATRSRPVRLALLAAVVVFLLGFAGFGAVSWNYTQHSNAFCTGCHVMNPAFERMAGGESEHSRLSCHDCHQQSIYASMRQLYIWVRERPEEIGPHARVPNRICEGCHVTGDTATWQRIASTAGHRVHLESDTSVLRNLQCVDCHGVEVHRFQPVNRTCGQDGCHDPGDTEIVLGRMAGQTVRHCTSCHEFTVQVPALATIDSARGTLVPGASQCLGCHEMRQMLADFDARRDPHGGKCGTCHNPHQQETPRDAAVTCATSGCHGDWRDEPFHTGTHRRFADQCLVCHQPHNARVDASACRDCHERVRRETRRQPPLPFDTAAALRRSHNPAVERRAPESHAQWSSAGFVTLASFDPTTVVWRPHVAPYAREPARTVPAAPVAPPPARPAADTFSHARHARLACLVCHQTGEGHGRLTFERPRGCQICHHQAPAQLRCANCHRQAEYAAPQPVTVTVTVPQHAPRPRAVDFLHSVHESRPCLECHTTPVTLLPPPAKATCRDCHEEHHAAGRSCSTCHSPAQPELAHRTLDAAHQRCNDCHNSAIITQLTPTRTLCGACHTAKLTGHYENRECSVCHFLAEPAAYRPRLMAAPRTR